MSAFSNFAESAIVEHFLRGNAQTSPAAVYLALFESDPGEDASGTECSFTGYARQVSTWSALDGSGQTKNSTAITFPANGNASGSVTATHAAVFDAATGGNMLIKGPLTVSKTIDVGDVFAVGSEQLVLTVD